jgi:hypothetical protein
MVSIVDVNVRSKDPSMARGYQLSSYQRSQAAPFEQQPQPSYDPFLIWTILALLGSPF